MWLTHCRTVKPPHVAESGFSMECELMHWYDIASDNGDPANTVIIGRIRMMHVVSTVLKPGAKLLDAAPPTDPRRKSLFLRIKTQRNQ
jgi:flavin reductase (DIM6/NTAB) family NADH-FMN oxidoreductase RutF